MMNQIDLPALAPLLPEIILAVSAIVLLMAGAFSDEDAAPTISIMTIVFMIFGIIAICLTSTGTVTFHGAFVVDGFARYLKILTLIAAAVCIAMTLGYARHQSFSRFEFPVLILLSTVGMMLMISANDMIGVYLGLELQSLAIYCVVAINRDSTRSTEAGLKYFVLGALSSGMLLYGISLIYGFTGATVFPDIAAVLGEEGTSLGVIFGLVFVLAGLAFKVSAVPFHMWTPDVYEGAPSPVTAFLAAAPKVAAMALFTRVVMSAFGPAFIEWQQILIFLSIMSMVLGAFAAIGQTNIKRLMAYSSIGHIGYALIGLASGSQEGIVGVVVYMTIYMVTTLGTFACILGMRRADEGMVEDISDLAGLVRTKPWMAAAFTLLLFSLAGIPPLVGFFAKFYVFLAAVKAGLMPLAIIGVLSSAVAAFYYLRIIKIMMFDDPRDRFEPMAGELRAVLAVSGAFSIFFFLVWTPILSAATAAAQSLF
ncbi:NADH-quinone oxidoreductase subunit NuoN [Acuticoccus sp. I52.16.1]|uniref:NADH-quinone oxidoreductase subunit NuoN n=1 Tax=Acuticoccus sp. I52.16.1 TaxID=2928472 RepID=UPI001FD0E2B6|nr:NADH-quinone oxidoreductase subunit NuoN [Acuticoccus sp. I52.16.1]UOM34215.1 NADH-quinone oxidoreductase subunit NuoN [Acuticoccus sp. I52.16.1]